MTTTTATITRLSQSLREPQLRQGREGCTQASGSTKQAHACPRLEDVALGRPTLPMPQNSWKPWWVSTAQGPGEGGRWHGPPISFAWTSPYKSGSPPRAVERPNVASGIPWHPTAASVPSSHKNHVLITRAAHSAERKVNHEVRKTWVEAHGIWGAKLHKLPVTPPPPLWDITLSQRFRGSLCVFQDKGKLCKPCTVWGT